MLYVVVDDDVENGWGKRLKRFFEAVTAYERILMNVCIKYNLNVHEELTRSFQNAINPPPSQCQ